MADQPELKRVDMTPERTAVMNNILAEFNRLQQYAVAAAGPNEGNSLMIFSYLYSAALTMSYSSDPELREKFDISCDNAWTVAMQSIAERSGGFDG